MAKKAAVKEKYSGPKGPMKVETPLPDKKKKTSTGLTRDTQFLGEALVKETNRINELELCIESMRLDLKRVMNRMGL